MALHLFHVSPLRPQDVPAAEGVLGALGFPTNLLLARSATHEALLEAENDIGLDDVLDIVSAALESLNIDVSPIKMKDPTLAGWMLVSSTPGQTDEGKFVHGLEREFFERFEFTAMAHRGKQRLFLLALPVRFGVHQIVYKLAETTGASVASFDRAIEFKTDD